PQARVAELAPSVPPFESEFCRQKFSRVPPIGEVEQEAAMGRSLNTPINTEQFGQLCAKFKTCVAELKERRAAVAECYIGILDDSSPAALFRVARRGTYGNAAVVLTAMPERAAASGVVLFRVQTATVVNTRIKLQAD